MRMLICCLACCAVTALSFGVPQPLLARDDTLDPPAAQPADEVDSEADASSATPPDADQRTDENPTSESSTDARGESNSTRDTEPPKPARRLIKPAVVPARTRLRANDGVGPIEDDELPWEPPPKPTDRKAQADRQTLADADNSTEIEDRSAIHLDPAALREVVPGVSTVAQLDAKWGSPSADQTRLGSGKRSYRFEPFEAVEVVLVEGKVASIEARLAQPSALGELAREHIDADDGEELKGSVTVRDEAGTALGIAYPERGLIFGFDADAAGQVAPAAANSQYTKQVAKILFDPIDAELFFLRAQQNQQRMPQSSLRDLEYVLEKNPQHGAARQLAARIYFDAGQLTEATGEIDAALKIDAANAMFLLTKAEILAESGDFTGCAQTCERVLRLREIAPEMKAKAQCVLGDCLASGPKRDHQHAIEYHLAAIKTAQPFAESPVAVQRRMAKQVLVLAQLGVANDIAWGYWQQKERAAPKWLAQAHLAAEDLIDREGADEILHLIVLRKALAASAGMQGKLDPVAWTKEAIKSGRRLIDAADDPWRRARLEWELGLALYDALQADQARGFHDHALSNSALVAKYLESALRQRQETPHGAYLLGRLYFRVGAIHAVELSDHRTAAGWFAKAMPFLERPLPATAAADVGRVGESFVSIGITYWETGRHDEALRVTKHGISLISQGIKERVIEQDALAVPYSNLAFMHRELGHAKEAENYAAMASRASATKRR